MEDTLRKARVLKARGPGEEGLYFQRSSSTANYRINPGDDHLPFEREGLTDIYFLIKFSLVTGVPILHLISTPFQSVWHTLGDKVENMDSRVVHDVFKVVSVFAAEYLQLPV